MPLSRTSVHSVVAAACALALLSAPALAQKSRDPLLARGDAAMAAFEPAEALVRYDSVLANDSTRQDALWRAAIAEAELAEFDDDPPRRARRYRRADARARAAVRADSASVEIRYALARVLGQQARVEGNLVRRATLGRETWEQAHACLRMAPKHPGCLHVLGVWHSNVAAVDGFTRRMASRLADTDVFAKGSWSEAERWLLAAIALEPKRIAHRLELGRVYAAQEKFDEARVQFAAAEQGEIMDSSDPRRKSLAARERQELP